MGSGRQLIGTAGKQLVLDTIGKSQRLGERTAHEGDFADIIIHPPGGPCSRREIGDIADPQDADGTVFRGHMHFAFENIDGFIPAEEPAKLTRRAIPHGGAGGTVAASRMIRRARLGVAGNDPFRMMGAG
jgi:hypothetical protein